MHTLKSKTLTIIKSSAYVQNYPLQAIDDDIACRMLMAPTLGADEHKSMALRLFDCLCHCLDERLTLATVSAAKLEELVRIFLGSLNAGDLAALKSTAYIQKLSRVLTAMAASLASAIPNLQPVDWSAKTANRYTYAWEQNKERLNPEIVHFWGGWRIQAKKGKPVWLSLVGMYKTHGPKFTKAFYEAMRRDALKRAKCQSNLINKLAAFITDNAFRFPAETFQSSELMEEFAEAYFWHYQHLEYERNGDANLNGKTFRTMRLIIVRTLIKTNIWNVDEDAFVIPPGLSKAGADRNVKQNKNGIEVKDKLLTEVPVHVTDIQAIDLLYGEVQRNLRTVEKYGLSEALKLRRAQRNRILQARSGTILEVVNRKSRHYDDFEKTGFNDICHTFEAEGMSVTVDARRRYGERLPVLGKLLGLPTSYSLFPIQCLLTIYHPEITAGFLEDLVIWDGPKRVSFYKTDRGYMLVGFKDRRGSKHSEQKILLCPRAAALVRMAEQITQPLRDYLKKNNDPNWQKLFLTSGTSFSYPKPASSNLLTKDKIEGRLPVRNMLIEQIGPFSEKQGDELVDFLKKLSITRVRAQSAVADYIKNQSLTRLARKLGHAFYNKDLMESYLPVAIYDFFATRYIRIFQKGIICEAMKDSPLLLRAAKFDTFEELHNFLSRYALKEIPENLRTLAENKVADGEVVEVGVSVSPASMTALISVRAAVKQSPEPEKVRGLATYWAQVCDKVEQFILKSSKPLLQQHLKFAYENHDASTFEKMIYATS
ncbi:hypothetical protein [Pseudomonas sp. LS-2]|jgi:hypothetical protein|uniref:hypothetical protein n=1 Tax=Pseudomonas sp. LS-2 TaxID=2315859 RepID=UPI002114374B|nr:hypothetical protein [Pseudomonas sp. LS-2]